MLKFVFLTEEFYKEYKNCTEIDKKQDRPYTMVIASINDIDFAIPLRSNIRHINESKICTNNNHNIYLISV